MKNINPLVTIAIPFYNAEKFLNLAIQSVCNQTYDNWELLLIDDGSTDSSLIIANSFKDNRIKVFSDHSNKGLVYRLNQSVRLAKGEFYARMDADDIMHCSRIEVQVKYLVDNLCVDVVGTAWYSIDNFNNIVSVKIPKESPSVNTVLNDICFLHPSVMGRKEWFVNNPYDARYVRMEDWELWLRTINSSVFSNIDIPLMFYREFGIPHWKKYVKTQIGMLKLFGNRRDYSLSFTRALFCKIKTVLKIGIFTMVHLVGQTDCLVKMRDRKKSSFDRIKAMMDLQDAIK